MAVAFWLVWLAVHALGNNKSQPVMLEKLKTGWFLFAFYDRTCYNVICINLCMRRDEGMSVSLRDG